MIGLALSPEQFQTLLRMVYIANTVANGHRDSTDFLKGYDDLEQYIFLRAKEVGFPGATSTHQIDGEEHYHPSRVFEGDREVNLLMDMYDMHVAISVLSEKLAERDMRMKHGVNVKDGMLADDYEALVNEISREYEARFLERGFDDIFVRGYSEDSLGK